MILLYKGKSTISKLIKWQTFGPYSHAAWWMRDASVVEAWHKGGVTHNISPATIHTPGTEIDVFDFEGGSGILAADSAEKFLLEQVGKKYDFRPVLAGFTLRRERNNPDKWFCSELVHAACIMGGYPLLARIPDSHIHPSLLSYSIGLVHIATLTTLDHREYSIRTVDEVPNIGNPLQGRGAEGGVGHD